VPQNYWKCLIEVYPVKVTPSKITEGCTNPYRNFPLSSHKEKGEREESTRPLIAQWRE
jgi:hypothetical protein